MSNENPGANDLRYEVITQEDPTTGDLIIPLPEPLLQSLGWKENTQLQIEIGTDGKLYLKRM